MNTIYYTLNLQLFAESSPAYDLTKTTTEAMSPTMKTFYNRSLLENAREESVFDQFAMPTPMTHGKTAEWRRFKTFAPAIEPMTEGVTPAGKTLGMARITASLTQHGDFTPVSDILQTQAIDPVIYGATEEMGAAGAKTSDLLIRNSLLEGTNVIYAGDSTAAAIDDVSDTAYLTPELINQAVTFLKKMNAPKINGYYVAIVNPSTAEDLRNSSDWKEFHKYNDTTPIFKGEIGELHGCKFIESNFAKVKKIGDNKMRYSTLIFGKDAFGKLDLEGGGMEMIIHDKHEIGGPLDQWSTVGYKFQHGSAILYPERIVNIWTSSSYYNKDEEN